MNDILSHGLPSIKRCAILSRLGAFVKYHRMARQKPQDQLATEAGMSHSTLSLLERDEKVNLITLIQVLRVLGQLHWLSEFEVKNTISPSEYIKLQKGRIDSASVGQIWLMSRQLPNGNRCRNRDLGSARRSGALG